MPPLLVVLPPNPLLVVLPPNPLLVVPPLVLPLVLPVKPLLVLPLVLPVKPLLVLPLVLPVKPLLVVLPVVPLLLGPPLADVLAPIPPLEALVVAPLDVLEPRLLPVAVVHFGFEVVVSPESSSHAPTVDASNIAATANLAEEPRRILMS